MLSLLSIPVWAWIAGGAGLAALIIAIILICVFAARKKKGKTDERKGESTNEDVTEAASQQKSAEEAPAKQNKKPAEKQYKVYHISKRKDDGKWQIKAEGGAKAIKLFYTQQEAIDYAKAIADNQPARVVVHKMDGSFRSLNYGSRK